MSDAVVVVLKMQDEMGDPVGPHRYLKDYRPDAESPVIATTTDFESALRFTSASDAWTAIVAAADQSWWVSLYHDEDHEAEERP